MYGKEPRCALFEGPSYQTACNVYVWKRAERSAWCQVILDAAMEREHVNQAWEQWERRQEKARSERQEKARSERQEKARSERLDKLYPPTFEEPPVTALTSEEREAALDEIDSYNTTPIGCGPA